MAIGLQIWLILMPLIALIVIASAWYLIRSGFNVSGDRCAIT